MTLVGDVPLGDAKAMHAATGRISFEDTSVPAGSPLCYAYWVRAYDQAGNLTRGTTGVPPRPRSIAAPGFERGHRRPCR